MVNKYKSYKKNTFWAIFHFLLITGADTGGFGDNIICSSSFLSGDYEIFLGGIK